MKTDWNPLLRGELAKPYWPELMRFVDSERRTHTVYPPPDEVFAALASVGFDGVISSCVFGWEEDADGVNVRQRDKAQALIDQHLTARSPRTTLSTSPPMKGR